MKNLEKLSKRVILGLGLVSIACIFSITFIEFDYDFESFFPQGDPETEFYKDFRDKFETDNDFIVVALENEQGIFQKDFLLRADSLSEELKKLPNVEEVISPTQIKEPIPLLEEQPVLLQQLELEIVVAQEVRLNAIQYKLLEGI